MNPDDISDPDLLLEYQHNILVWPEQIQRLGAGDYYVSLRQDGDLAENYLNETAAKRAKLIEEYEDDSIDISDLEAVSFVHEVSGKCSEIGARETSVGIILSY